MRKNVLQTWNESANVVAMPLLRAVAVLEKHSSSKLNLLGAIHAIVPKNVEGIMDCKSDSTQAGHWMPREIPTLQAPS